MRTRIKFCGCTSPRDAEAAVELGVDAVGVIFAPASPRHVEPPLAREIAHTVPAGTSLIGVFVEPSETEVRAAIEAGFTPQFCGDESAQVCESAAAGPYIKVFHIGANGGARLDPAAFDRSAALYAHATWMFDTLVPGRHGGTGQAFDWDLALTVARNRPVIVSGGLTADNVGACIQKLRPYGVDVRSGIETGGVKDFAKMRAFVRAVKEADEQA